MRNLAAKAAFGLGICLVGYSGYAFYALTGLAIENDVIEVPGLPVTPASLDTVALTYMFAYGCHLTGDEEATIRLDDYRAFLDAADFDTIEDAVATRMAVGLVEFGAAAEMRKSGFDPARHRAKCRKELDFAATDLTVGFSK